MSIPLSNPASYNQRPIEPLPNLGSPAVGQKRGRAVDEDDDFVDSAKDANVEVDERGVIYMAGGRKLNIVPTKIQVCRPVLFSIPSSSLLWLWLAESALNIIFPRRSTHPCHSIQPTDRTSTLIPLASHPFAVPL